MNEVKIDKTIKYVKSPSTITVDGVKYPVVNDIREVVNGHYNFMPAIGVTVKFMFNSKNNEYLKAHDWDQSEMITSAAWQQKYESLQVVSGGLKLKLGLKDTTPPVIKLWDEE